MKLFGSIREETAGALSVCAFANLLLMPAGPATAGDADRCIVRLFPPGADDAWRKATMRLDERVRTLPQASTDCRELEVSVAGNRASLTFVTRDGRKAVRDVAMPSELVPTAETLFVTLPAPASAPAGPPTPLPAATLPPRRDVAEVQVPPDRERSAIVFGAAGGARLGFPGPYASPTVSVMAGVSFSHWELAVRGQWDMAHASLGSTLPDGFRLSAWALYASAGRRESFGSASLSYGSFLGMSYAYWQVPIAPPSNGQGTNGDGSNPVGITNSTGRKTEPRLGLYLGTSIPRRSWIRFHPELTIDAVVSRIGRGLDVGSAVQPLPWLGTALSFRVEGELP